MIHKWAVFISGRGSNLQALLDTLEENRIVLVVSSSAKAAGLVKAKRAGVPTLILPKKIDWSDLQKRLSLYGVTRIFLAGFMKIIPQEFLLAWENKILNVHPSLLPAFPGLAAIENSYKSGQEMGVTVHVVTPEMDAGPQLLKKVAVSREKIESCGPKLLTLPEAEFLISLTEQRLVREALVRFNGGRIFRNTPWN